MVARELISNLIPPLKTSDSGDKALVWMHEFMVTHLPIVNDKQFLGLISEEDILDLSDPGQPIGNHELSLQRPFVNEFAHVYEVIKVAAALKLSIIPVVNEEENYIGVITPEDLIHYFSEFNSISEKGGIVVLEMSKNSYSLAEIARLVETDNVIILSSQVTSRKDSTEVEVTLKLNTPEMKNIISTFERFNYKIKATFQETEYFDYLKDRYDSLMNYLNI